MAVATPRARRVRRARPFRHVTFTLGLAITLALVATAAVSLVYTPRDPLEMSIAGRLAGPDRRRTRSAPISSAATCSRAS